MRTHQFENGISTFRNGPKTVKIDWNTETISTTMRGETSTKAITKDMELRELLKIIHQ